jgi:hypothetical protein
MVISSIPSVILIPSLSREALLLIPSFTRRGRGGFEIRFTDTPPHLPL